MKARNKSVLAGRCVEILIIRWLAVRVGVWGCEVWTREISLGTIGTKLSFKPMTLGEITKDLNTNRCISKDPTGAHLQRLRLLTPV